MALQYKHDTEKYTPPLHRICFSPPQVLLIIYNTICVRKLIIYTYRITSNKRRGRSFNF